MGDIKTAVKTAVMTLAVIYVLNQVSVTQPLVQKALNGY
jgi:hypothetical protein